MDAMLLNQKTVRIKGKKAAILVNPTSSIGKTEGAGAIFLKDYPDNSIAKIEGARISIKGPGEYEISGIKISATLVDRRLVARLDVDNIKLLVGSGEAVEKIHEKAEECNVAIIEADSEFNYSILTSLEPNILIVYGEKKEDVKKTLGKDEAQSTSKFSITSEKLPEEMQMVLLG